METLCCHFPTTERQADRQAADKGDQSCCQDIGLLCDFANEN